MDISKIEYKYKFLVRYIDYREVRLKAYGYYTDNYNEIENTQGKELELLDRSHYTNGTFYILKDDSELKKVILKLNVSIPYTFGIRYGEQERHYIKSFLFSLAFGVVLAIPNIIAQIYMFCIKER